MSSFYGNASIGSGLPEVNNNDNGKVLIAKDGEWELGFPSADGLPAVTENDNGKTLIVEDGSWSVGDSTGGLQNLIDGSATGSVRGINTAAEDENYTIGSNAFAEGNNTKASGYFSHAEGSGSAATGYSCHAEGASSTAAGSCDHAEGSATANGYCTHAEGYKTNTTSSGSHAEGNETSATNRSAHAEGNHTAASGDGSHAEGFYSVANHKSQHVFGEYNIADPSETEGYQRGNYVEIVGNGTENARSNARTLDWNGNEVLAGKLTIGVAPTDNMDVTTKQYVDTAISNAGGLKNLVDGSTEGSVRNVHALRENSTYKMGVDAFAEGANTKASGMYSHAEGIGSAATNHSAHAEGQVCTASGTSSHAEGTNTIAQSQGSHSEGSGTTASGDGSHAEGEHTTASGFYSHAEGYYSTASGVGSHAEGSYSVANHKSQHVFGEYNIADPSTSAVSLKGTYVEIVGNGTADNTRSNARTLDWNGNEVLAGSLTVKGGSLTLGDTTFTENDLDSSLQNLVDGASSGSVRGVNTSTQIGQYALAEGYNTKATGEAAHAEGNNTQAISNYSHAEGSMTYAAGEAAHAEGSNAQATGSAAHAEGANTIANHAYQHVFGQYNIEDNSETENTQRGNYVEIVGNGAAGTRSNARTLDWDGNEVLAGKLTVGAAPTGNMDVTTKQYVDTAIINASNAGLPPVTTADNGKTFVASNGEWTIDNVDLGYTVTKSTESFYNDSLIMNADDNGIYSTYINDENDTDWSNVVGLQVTLNGKDPIILNKTLKKDGHINFGDFDEDNFMPLFDNEEIVCQYNSDGSLQVYAKNDQQSIVIEKIVETVGTTHDFQSAVNNAIDFIPIKNIVDGSKSFDDNYQSQGSVRGIFAEEDNDDEKSGNYYVLGRAAVALGDGTKASGYDSMAIGNCTTAAGVNSFAEGSNTKADGMQSHVEGEDTYASGQNTHAEGRGGEFTIDNITYKSRADGKNTHAEGYQTIASCNVNWGAAHAEGVRTQALGEGSHAEGGQTIASQRAAHAEGAETTASGQVSHAEGSRTIASGTCSHAEGSSTIVSGINSHGEGELTTVSGNNAHAEGWQTTASGLASHAEGYNTTAAGKTSGNASAAHAEGYSTQATGDASHSEGRETIASRDGAHAEGGYTQASGVDAHAEGYKSIANHRSQHVFGEYNIADTSSQDASQRGNYVEIVGNGSSENNRSNIRTLDWDGNEILAGTLTVGMDPTSNLQVATKQYVDNTINTNALNNLVDGSQAGSIRTTAAAAEENGYTIGANAFAEGDSTQASGIAAHAEGSESVASGQGAHAEGQNTTASGSFAHAEGYSTTANHAYQHVFGQLNIPDPAITLGMDIGTYVEIVGNGVDGTESNARTLDWDGNEVLAGKLTVGAAPVNDMDVATKQYVDTTVNNADRLKNLVDGSATGSVRGVSTVAENANYTIGQNAFAEGNNTKAAGNYSHAEGVSTEALGLASHAEGNGTDAEGKFSHAEGNLTGASGANSHSEGNSTFAVGKDSHAEGCGTNARGSQSHAEGFYTMANHRSQHVFGEHNIADGSSTESTQRGTYVEIVGNGTSTATSDRSNARTLDWDGNEWLAGKLTIGSDPVNNMDVTTKQYVDTAVSNVSSGSGLQNLVDGGTNGSVRGVNTLLNDSEYTIGANAFTEGFETSAAGEAAHAEGNETIADGDYSHAEGYNTTASERCSHAEGTSTIASGPASHAEGFDANATGQCAHAEGYYTTASGNQGSHAEGNETNALGDSAHAEGGYTTASGLASHAEGIYTIANHASQHVFGDYNIADPSSADSAVRGTYVEIVGNGTSRTRSNARTLDWNGNEVLAGGLTVGAAGITIGSTTITEAQLQALLAMLNS